MGKALPMPTESKNMSLLYKIWEYVNNTFENVSYIIVKLVKLS